MTDNPYQSPAVTEGAAEQPRQLSVWLMAPIGIVLGAVVSAIAGGLGGLILGAAFYSMYPALTYIESFQQRKPLICIEVWVLSTAYIGWLVGGVLGGMFGLAAGRRQARTRRSYLIGATAAGAVPGALIGTLGILVGVAQPTSVWGTPLAYALWAVAGFVVGTLVGAATGRLLGGMLARICWGRVPRWATIK